MDSVVGKTKHGELTIDQIAEMQPGLGRLMPEVSDAYAYAYYAAKARNFPLARYFLRKVSSLLRLGAVTRPKTAKLLGAYEAGVLSSLGKAVEAGDLGAFEAAYERGIQVANRMHAETGHAEIVWKLPPEPPGHLELAPRGGSEAGAGGSRA